MPRHSINSAITMTAFERGYGDTGFAAPDVDFGIYRTSDKYFSYIETVERGLDIPSLPDTMKFSAAPPKALRTTK